MYELHWKDKQVLSYQLLRHPTVCRLWRGLGGWGGWVLVRHVVLFRFGLRLVLKTQLW